MKPQWAPICILKIHSPPTSGVPGSARWQISLVWLLFSLRAFFGVKSNCISLSKKMHSSLSRLCLGPHGSFFGRKKKVIIRFDLTFLEGTTPQFLVSLHHKCFFVLYKIFASWGFAEHNEGAGGTALFSGKGLIKKQNKTKNYREEEVWEIQTWTDLRSYLLPPSVPWGPPAELPLLARKRREKAKVDLAELSSESHI